MILKEYTDENDLKKIEELYTDAFPESERKPFGLMAEKINNGIEMLAIEDCGNFLGLAIVLIHGNIALLDYFAITPQMRGKNIGSNALDLLKKKYSEKILLIEIEDTDEESENHADRIRRKSFYLRNGMIEMPYKVWFYGTKMQVLTNGESITFKEHSDVYTAILGKQVSKNITLAKFD